MEMAHSVCLLIGGTKVSADLTYIAEHGANVVIGTPGRLKEIFQLNIQSNYEHMNFKELEYFIMGKFCHFGCTNI